MLHDHVAECLEKKGLYRRAAERWAKVMVQLSDDQKRKVAAQKRAECLRKGAPDSGFTGEPDRNKTSGQQTTF